MRSIRDHYEARYAGLPSTAGETPPGIARVLPHLLSSVGARPQRVLDFGCNRGHAARALAQAGHRVVGVDVSESVLHVAAAENSSHVSFVGIDSQGMLPFADAIFDACLSSEVIEHLFDAAGFLAEANRVLRPNGLLLLTTPYHGCAKNVLVALWNFDRHFNPTGGHLRFFTPRSLSRCLAQAGFAVERISGIGRFWPVWRLMLVTARKVEDR